MGKLQAIFFCLLCLGFLSAQSPNVVAVLNKNVIDKVKGDYFNTIFGAIGEQSLPSIEQGDFVSSGGRFTIRNNSPNNLQISLNKAKNSLGVEIRETEFRSTINWEYSRSFISITGTMEISGSISLLSMDLVMDSMKEEDHFIPQVNLQNFWLQMDRSSLQFGLHCDYCPGELGQLVTNWMQSELMIIVEDLISRRISQEINHQANLMFTKTFPRSIPLTDSLSISTVLTDEITIGDSDLKIPIEGSLIFEGLKREKSQESFEILDHSPKTQKDLSVFLSSNLITSLSEILNSQKLTFNHFLFGLECEIIFDPLFSQSELYFVEGGLMVITKPRVYFTDNLGFELGIKASLAPELALTANSDLVDFSPNFWDVSLSELKIIFFGRIFNFDSFASVINLGLERIIQLVEIPKIEMPKPGFSSLEITEGTIDFDEQFAEIGISFD